MALGKATRIRHHIAAGDRHRRAEDYASAGADYVRALALIDRIGAWWQSPLTQLNWARAAADGRTVLGQIDLERGRPDLARHSFEEAERRYAEISYHESADVAIVLNNLGVVYERLGMLVESERALRRAVEIDRLIGRGPEDVAVGLANLALSYQAAGYLDEAGQAIEHAADLAGLKPGTIQRLAEERSFHLMTRGKFAEALVKLTEQFEAATPGSIDAAHLAGNLAQAYAELQNAEMAQRWHERAVEIRRKRQPGSLPLAIALSNLAHSLVGTGDTDEAARTLDEAITLAERIAPQGAELATMRGARAWQLLDAGDPAAALALGERALAAAPGAGRQLTALRLAIAAAYKMLDRPDVARAMLETARDVCERISPVLPELRWVHTMLGEFLLDHGAVDEAAQCFDRAIEVAETMRPGSADEPGLGLLFGTARSAYHGRIEAAWRRGTADDTVVAFHAAESFRARALAESLAQTVAAAPPGGAAAALDAELGETRRRLGALYRRIEAVPDDPLIDERDRLEERAESLRLRLRALDPRSADRDYPKPSTLTEVQHGLDETTTVAIYEVTDDGVFLFAIRRDSFAFTKLEADVADIAAAVAEVGTACHDRAGTAPADALRRLGSWLLGPIADRLGDLAVCADDVLAGLPFEALELDGVALLERSTVWSVPSATILTRFGAERRSRRPEQPFAGFAMPETPGQGPLPASLREVRRVADILGGEPPVVGTDLTVATVRSRAARARYVHFAMHGVIKDRQPLYSGFPLAGEEFLHAYEIAGFDLCADLVVCSACDTAKGESRAGEGTVGLAYALFTAGARAVLVSRWPISDPISARYMRRLYRRLAVGETAAQAVRGVALELRHTHPHPREWAALALIDLGTGRAVE
ncbi:CHAT domain-containing protein [Micromonospora sp. WMMD1274]|uniref:CHAT domain-containing protein n=1 Tax=Micromonospora sp. WMMD1274 TaxID=3404116 RepID=UPI003B950685